MTPTSLFSFQIAVSELGGRNATAVHMCLSSAWANPARGYHTRQHLTECLELVTAWGRGLTAIERATLALAVWFHDAVYDPRRPDNEEQSAALAFKALRHVGVSEEHCVRVRDLVLATDHAKDVPAGDRLTNLMLDIDLAILGAPASRFEEYQAQVRKEYGWVDEADYAVGRARVLGRFKDQACAEPPALYRTEHGRRLLGQARQNLNQAH